METSGVMKEFADMGVGVMGAMFERMQVGEVWEALARHHFLKGKEESPPFRAEMDQTYIRHSLLIF